jgi:hypothetical protein
VTDARSTSPERSDDVRVIDTTALHALAHPLRIRLWDELSMHGPATATTLGRLVGESSGSTSYHLRQLAKHGFIEEDTERGTARERWWRPTPGSSRLPMGEMRKSPATRAALDIVVGEIRKLRGEHLERWWATRDQWPDVWNEAAASSTSHLRLTPPEAKELARQINDVIVEWARLSERRVQAGYVHEGDDPLGDVAILFDAFPTGTAEGAAEEG